MSKLKLFVWEDCLQDYSTGIMFALARNEDEARELISKELYNPNHEDLARRPRIVEKAEGFAIMGGM